MDLNYERIKNLEYKVIDKIIYFLMEPENKKYLDTAKDAFNKLFDELEFINKDEGFLLWLIWDYPLKDNMKIIEKYSMINQEKLLDNDEKKMLKSLKNGKFSVFRIIDNDGIILKDLFTHEETKLENLLGYTKTDNNNIIFGRVYEFENNNFIFDDYIMVDKSFRAFIERNIYEKYENYISYDKNINISDFINENSLLIYKLGAIIKRMIEEQNSNEDYKVWQSVYVFEDKSAILDRLLKSDNIILEYEENNQTFLKLYNPQRNLIAEIAIQNNKMEIECNNKSDIAESKELLERLLADMDIKHSKDEVLTIEDLL